MNGKLGSFGDICQMVKIEHSIFALPYAWAGAFLAARGMPSWMGLLWLTLAMVAVRSFAMTCNRILDVEIDRSNPRTSGRPLVTGAIDIPQAKLFCLGSALVFVGACALLNSICFWLSFPALAFAAAYSLTKRYTCYCHFWLGATLGLAPLAGWLAVDPASLGIPALMLFFAVTFWVGAFDVYYSFQDLDFDKEYGLHSLPVDMGAGTALALAGFAHILTVIFLILTGITASLGWPWYVLCAAVAALLLIEHRLVNPDDLRRINMAFFTFNGIISQLVLAGIICGIYF